MAVIWQLQLLMRSELSLPDYVAERDLPALM
jgi:hypothetical protein